MARVLGIGGCFMSSATPERLATWYGKHLGLALDCPQAGEWNPAPVCSTFAALPLDDERFDEAGPGPGMVLGLVVEGIETLVDELVAAGATLLLPVRSGGLGKFASFRDPEGNHFDLWEPSETVHRTGSVSKA